jgi:hypothetical protein
MTMPRPSSLMEAMTNNALSCAFSLSSSASSSLFALSASPVTTGGACCGRVTCLNTTLLTRKRTGLWLLISALPYSLFHTHSCRLSSNSDPSGMNCGGTRISSKKPMLIQMPSSRVLLRTVPTITSELKGRNTNNVNSARTCTDACHTFSKVSALVYLLGTASVETTFENVCIRLVDEAIAQVEQLVQADAEPVFEQHAIAVLFFNLVRHGDGARLVEVVRRNGNGIFHLHEDEHGTPRPCRTPAAQRRGQSVG